MTGPRRIPLEPDARAVLATCYAAAIAGAQPGPAVAAAVASYPLAGTSRVHVIALGKAAHGMADATVTALAAHGLAPAGGLVVAHAPAPAGHPAIDVVVGDHPIPGPRSARAADALGEAAGRVGPLDVAIVLISGGTSSLVSAPVISGLLTPETLAATSRTLLTAGLPIDVVNAVRKRVSRWGAGRLATALRPARVLCLIVSDVPGDDPAVIGSGPCAPDPWTAVALRDALAMQGVWSALPDTVRAYLDLAAAVARLGLDAETPKLGDATFAGVRTQVIRTNADARASTADAARAAGFDVIVHDAWLTGEAAPLGRSLAAVMVATPPGTVHVWGGEPSVTVGDAPDARGGRMQELALAAAAVLDATGPRGEGIAVLAAGTDGRDGPTDAAGAVVDASTWARIRARGRDPDADLAAHRSRDALAAAGALLPAAPTGTNVADVVIGINTGAIDAT